MNAPSAAAFQAASFSTAGKSHTIIITPSATSLRSSYHGNNHDKVTGAPIDVGRYSSPASFDFGNRPSPSRIPPSPRSSSLLSSRRSFLSFITAAAVTTSPLTFTEDPTSPSPRQLSLSLSPPLSPSVANAAETVGKDDSCNDASCLGVWDGLLADCPHATNKLKGGGGAGCVSSQDDTPGIFAEPWDYSDAPSYSSPTKGEGDVDSLDDAYKGQMDQLILALETTSRQRGVVVDIAYKEGRYYWRASTFMRLDA